MRRRNGECQYPHLIRRPFPWESLEERLMVTFALEDQKRKEFLDILKRMELELTGKIKEIVTGSL